MKVLVDTSFLLFCAQRGRNYLAFLEDKVQDRLQPVVIKGVVEELRRLASRRGKMGKMAETALQLVQSMEVLESFENGRVDDLIIQYADKLALPVVTVDAALVKKLAAKNLEYMSVSGAGKPIVRLKFR
ncbi:MAG: hypothetical protein RMI43_01325 [Candidatus Caldarchaeum sp.]|nr:hypothetical protein [Candidatus Caldarchaeum sp.]MCS7133602.1 hypothetical protein [Candidatus Caldarchaeum sp.]MDW8062796.1 hypothetical protein [Candidatus Caldarchaeum sp.]MDW8435030.1 hypothetical protein [Candidatus Caldarchaeum sp.]